MHSYLNFAIWFGHFGHIPMLRKSVNTTFLCIFYRLWYEISAMYIDIQIVEESLNFYERILVMKCIMYLQFMVYFEIGYVLLFNLALNAFVHCLIFSCGYVDWRTSHSGATNAPIITSPAPNISIQFPWPIEYKKKLFICLYQIERVMNFVMFMC